MSRTPDRLERRPDGLDDTLSVVVRRVSALLRRGRMHDVDSPTAAAANSAIDHHATAFQIKLWRRRRRLETHRTCRSPQHRDRRQRRRHVPDRDQSFSTDCRLCNSADFEEADWPLGLRGPTSPAADCDSESAPRGYRARPVSNWLLDLFGAAGIEVGASRFFSPRTRTAVRSRKRTVPTSLPRKGSNQLGLFLRAVVDNRKRGN